MMYKRTAVGTTHCGAIPSIPPNYYLFLLSMFTIKVTYHGQTRKAILQDLTSLPSFLNICAEVSLPLSMSITVSHLLNTFLKINRLFPITNDVYLSKLLFSPDASSSTILLSKEVRTAQDYLKCTRSFKDFKWQHGMLKFSVHDIDSSILPSFGAYCLAFSILY